MQSYGQSVRRELLIRWRRVMKDRVELIRYSRSVVDALFSNRKVLVIVLVVLALLLYLWPNWIRLSRDEVTTDPSSWCVDDLIARDYAKDLEKYNSIVHRFPLHRPTEKPFIAFTGNGHIALAPEMKVADLRIRHGRSVSLGTGFQPVIEVSVEDLTSSGAYLTEFTQGSVTRLDFYAMSSHCLSITSTVYAHRTRPSVFVQDVTIINPLDRSFEVHFKRPAFKWTDDTTIKIGGSDLHVVTGKVKVPGDSQGKIYVVSAVLPTFAEMINVKPQKTETFHFVTVLEASAAYKADTYDQVKTTLAEKTQKVYGEVSGILKGKLFAEHSDVWSGTGFSVSKSLAPSVLNGDLINATMYYLLSNTPAPLHESQPGSVLDHYNKALSNPDRCYSSHNTLLYPSKLWTDLSSLQEIADTVETWKLTLEKRGGCVELLEAGADGLLQAMVLSFGGLKFTQHHLEFNTHPQDLHRNYQFRQIAYSNVSYVNIWIEIDQNNRPVMFVSVNSSAKDEKGNPQKLLACDAGCLDSPVQLTGDRIQLPVKLTDPLTPILYITDDSKHMNELKHTIHVKEVVEAPGIENHVIAMHKHGHRLGGLPTIFWVSLVFLIVVFHLFLCTLIYNEYCRGGDQRPQSFGRSRYSV